eukprot:gene9789-biopygen5825
MFIFARGGGAGHGHRDHGESSGELDPPWFSCRTRWAVGWQVDVHIVAVTMAVASRMRTRRMVVVCEWWEHVAKGGTASGTRAQNTELSDRVVQSGTNAC